MKKRREKIIFQNIIFSIFLILSVTGILAACSNPTERPNPRQCDSDTWNICANTCASSVRYGSDDFEGVTGVEGRIEPVLTSMNKFCQQATGESTSYAFQALIHNYCSACDQYLVSWTGSAWNSWSVCEGTLNAQHVYCAKGCTPSCTPKTCANYPNQCGSSLDNGCNGTIDCSGACTGGKVCNPSTGFCEEETCTDSQVIMKLSNPTNAHGGLWNDASYTYKVCYNTIFGSSYTGANPHTCTATNKVIGLSQPTDALGEIPSRSDYSVKVCYGNLTCRSETGPGGCSVGRVVVRLKTYTSSNISNAADTSFPIKICCPVPPATGSAFWNDMMDHLITTANIGDTVKLVVDSTIVAGKEINYTVWEDSGLPFGWFDKKVAQSSSRGYTIWKTTEAGNFYFIAEILDGSGQTFRSGNLQVSGYANSLPTAKIIKPVNESTFIIPNGQRTTGNIQFEQISSDVDDDLNITWEFGDGWIAKNSNCLTGANCNTTHSYNSSGTKIVELTASEMTRSQSAIDRSRIYVYKKGLNIFAIIDSPNYEEGYLESGVYWINGTSSHIANCSFSDIECIAAASGKPCYEIIDSINPALSLWCYKFKESNSPGFAFRWTIAPGNFVNNTNYIPFQKWFYEAGEHIINLRVTASY